MESFPGERVIELKAGYFRVSCPGLSTSNSFEYFSHAAFDADEDVAQACIVKHISRSGDELVCFIDHDLTRVGSVLVLLTELLHGRCGTGVVAQGESGTAVAVQRQCHQRGRNADGADWFFGIKKTTHKSRYIRAHVSLGALEGKGAMVLGDTVAAGHH